MLGFGLGVLPAVGLELGVVLLGFGLGLGDWVELAVALPDLLAVVLGLFRGVTLPAVVAVTAAVRIAFLGTEEHAALAIGWVT